MTDSDKSKVVAAYSIKFKGDWNEIYENMISKTPMTISEANQFLSSLKCKYITILDEGYPTDLKQTYHPPFCLFYYGDISLLTSPTERKLSVVGTRNPTEYGIKGTKSFVSELAKDFIIVSGMAAGVDAIAHWTAIENKGKTIAVLGCGIDYCYPSDNILLYNRLKKDYLIISEYPNNIPPSPDKFPARNRIVAFLSIGTLITEAYEKSGSSITATLAAAIGREVMCIPDVVSKKSCCNRLIKEGAMLVEDPSDVEFQLRRYTEKISKKF